MSGRVADRVAIVVGAGQTPGDTIGNGRAIALRLAEEGARVVCVDRVAERAQGTASEIEQRGGIAAHFTADITQTSAGEAVVAFARATFGRIDILVNNVGIGGGGDGPAHSAHEAAWDRILTVNLKGAWMMCRAVLPMLREQQAGVIVNVSSLASLGGATQICYEVSKAGMNRLTTSVASANARQGVRCNAILPGFLDTPMAIEGISAEHGIDKDALRRARAAAVPLGGRMGTAWDTANAVLFLSSDEAVFITGVLLPVDGGMSTGLG